MKGVSITGFPPGLKEHCLEHQYCLPLYCQPRISRNIWTNMYKRVENKRKKQEKEEELGLDAEMKEVLGLHDTDSDESSSSGDDSSGEEGQDEFLPGMIDKGDEGEDEDEAEEEEETEDDGDSEDDDVESPMSVPEALNNPLYTVSLEPDVKACIVCPGKLLKNTIMAEVHQASQAHIRRYTRFTQKASKAGPDIDVRDLVESRPSAKAESSVGALSKRAQKRKARQSMNTVKRENHKIMKAKAKARKEAKAKEAVESSATDTVSFASKSTLPRPQKQRKVGKEVGGRNILPAESQRASSHRKQPTSAMPETNILSSPTSEAKRTITNNRPKRELKNVNRVQGLKSGVRKRRRSDAD
ncbi:hypothetical protein AcW1_008295 [Taiwanofungus camphoratus]|nr:hypothetical protein AcW1_008295 [Antrodia cinnamomea]KAI0956072.1 hypothetical protein AcV7_006578 [Antrodia cinnamomea]